MRWLNQKRILSDYFLPSKEGRCYITAETMEYKKICFHLARRVDRELMCQYEDSKSHPNIINIGIQRKQVEKLAYQNDNNIHIHCVNQTAVVTILYGICNVDQ